jgi:hypothetical protein
LYYFGVTGANNMDVMDRSVSLKPSQRKMAPGCVNRVRVGFRLSQPVLDQLDAKVERLGVTRSAGLSLAICRVIDGHGVPVLVPEAMRQSGAPGVQVTLNPALLDRLNDMLAEGNVFHSTNVAGAFAEAILAWVWEER